MEFKNPGYQGVSLNEVSLFYYTFDGGCVKTGKIWSPRSKANARRRSFDSPSHGSGAVLYGGSCHPPLPEPWELHLEQPVRGLRGSPVQDRTPRLGVMTGNPTEGRVLARIAGTNKLA